MRPCTRCPLPVTLKDAVPDGDGVRHAACPDPLPKRRNPPRFKYVYEMTDEEKYGTRNDTDRDEPSEDGGGGGGILSLVPSRERVADPWLGWHRPLR